MGIFDDDFDRLIFAKNPDVGLKMIIALHDLTLGDALGGIRYYNYASAEDALRDALRLAEGMTYKNAIIYRLSRGLRGGRLSHGGGKAVIWGNPRTEKTPELLYAAADAINDLHGKYIGGEDMNMRVEDVEVMFERTEFITGLQETHYRGGRRGSGNPAPVTALGVFEGLRSCLRVAFGSDWMMPRTFSIQGVGNVGKEILEYLTVRARSSKITITDSEDSQIRKAVLTYPGIQVIEPENSDDIYDVECDIFIPCAVGGILNDDTIPRLKCKIVAGAANNQLLEPRHGEMLHERGIIYAPDYVINAGGAINVAMELRPFRYDHDEARKLAEKIGPLLSEIFEEAKRTNTPPEKIADRMAEAEIKRVKDFS